MNRVDPMPIVDLANQPCLTALTLINRVEDLPFPTSFQVYASDLGDHLHIAALDEKGKAARHLALDRSGSIAGAATALPLSFVAGMTSCARELAVTGARLGDDQPVVMGLNSLGAPQWEAGIQRVGELSRWHKPICLSDQLRVVWETGVGNSTFWMSDILGGNCNPPRSLPFESQTGQLEVITAGQGLTLARTHGKPARLELLRIIGSQLLQRATVSEFTQPLTPSLAVVGQRYIVLSITDSGQALRAQWFNWDLKPVDQPQTVAAVASPTCFHSARLIQGNAGYLAISYRTVTVGAEWLATPDSDAASARFEPKHSYEQFVGLFQWQLNQVTAIQRVTPPAVGFEAGEWLGNRLFVIHGEFHPVVSIYQGA